MKIESDLQHTAATGVASDWHPFVTARAWPSDAISDAFEAWEPKHVADLVGGPGVVSGAYYHAVTTGIPEAFIGSGTTMAYYSGRDLQGLFAFLQSQVFADAVAEGEQWFGQFHPTDFEEITGNIYTVDAVVRNAAGAAPEELPYTFWQRFEVPDRDAAEFGDWLDEHAAALAAADGVARVRTFSAVREGCPLPYYYSRGNRMVAADAASLDPLVGPAVRAALAGSLPWDLRLDYVKRDVYAYRYHYDSGHGGEY